MDTGGDDLASPFDTGGDDLASPLDTGGDNLASPLDTGGDDLASPLDTGGDDLASPLDTGGDDLGSPLDTGGDEGTGPCREVGGVTVLGGEVLATGVGLCSSCLLVAGVGASLPSGCCNNGGLTSCCGLDRSCVGETTFMAEVVLLTVGVVWACSTLAMVM